MKYVDDYNATIECAKKESWAEGWAESWTECRKETLAEVFSVLDSDTVVKVKQKLGLA
jgi:hypothetical protein